MPLTPENLKDRQSGIGASEIAAVVGLSPWSSPLDVWTRKCRPDAAPEVKGNAIDRGNWLESRILDWTASKFPGLIVRPNEDLARNPDHPIVIATPDGYGFDRRELDRPSSCFEVKSPGDSRDWTAPADCFLFTAQDGTKIGKADGVPLYYLAQCQWQLLSCGLQTCFVGALVWGFGVRGELWVYRVDAHADFQAALLEAGERFWLDHVETDTPPIQESKGTDLDTIKRLYPQKTDDLTPVLPELVEKTIDLCSVFRDVKERIKADTAERDRIHAILAGMVGEGSGLDLGKTGPRVTYRTNKPSTVTDWEGLARSLGATDEQIGTFTKEQPGARQMRVTLPKALPAKKEG